jgi:DNA-binding IclR family transcriptional regulator
MALFKMTRSMPSEARSSSQVAGTAAFSKFMHLLQIIAEHPGPLTVPELSKLSGYPRPTVYRTVAALVTERLLEMGPVTGHLVLGPGLIALANRSWGRSEIRLASLEDLKRLRDITGETIHLAVLNGVHMTYVEKLESPSAVQMSSRIGTSVPLYSTAVGKAFLAALTESRRESMLKQLPEEFETFTPNTIGTKALLRAQLRETSERGWSIDDEERETGICCYGAAIRGRDGQPIAAVSVSTLRFRQTGDAMETYIRPLINACNLISTRIAETPASFDYTASII